MKKNATAKALVMSVLALMLCLSMLVGTTFAWFTDSVTSGVNKIVAGNLDVVLEYSTDPDNEESWAEVTEATNVFEEDALWEPGYTEVVYLRVKNAGNLALKYQLGIYVATNNYDAENQPIDLSQYIKFGVAETENKYETRDAAREAVQDSAALISEGYSSEDCHLIAGAASDILALVVYMPEETGNEANHITDKTAPEINLGIKLVATQDTVESDSFGTDYDKDAGYPVLDTAGLKSALAKGGIVELVAPVTAENENTAAGRNMITQDTVLNMGDNTITFENDATDDSLINISALYLMSGGTTMTLNANEGGIDSDFYGIVVGSSANAEGDSLIINGGTYKAGSVVQVQNGTVTINGGFFDGRSVYGGGTATFLLNCIDSAYKNGTANIIVTGGTFVNFDPSNNRAEGANTNFVAEGYTVTSETQADGSVWYTVVPA